MNILLTGCSFGVPNYFGPPGPPPEHHIEFLLKELGYNVYNCSLNGGSNLDALDRLEKYLQGDLIRHPAYTDKFLKLETHLSCIDWVIWFHTEILRDYIRHSKGIYLDQAIDNLSNLIYSKMLYLKNKFQFKLAIIGGCSPIRKNLYKYVQPEFVIEDWKSDIVGIKLPEVQSLYALSAIEISPDSLEYKNNLLSKHKIILDKLQDSKHFFPDNIHPGTIPHADLVSKIDKVFKN